MLITCCFEIRYQSSGLFIFKKGSIYFRYSTEVSLFVHVLGNAFLNRPDIQLTSGYASLM